MAMSAIIIARQNFASIDAWHENLLSKLKINQTRHIHFKNLNDRQKATACQYLSNLPLRIFTVLSNKRTMRQHENQNAQIRGGKQWFYNWIVRILLERVTDYCERRSNRSGLDAKKIHIVFATTGMHSYSQTAAYHEILKIQTNAENVLLDKLSPNYSVLDAMRIDHFLARDVPGLQLADIAASAFFNAVDNLDTGPCSPEYAKMLSTRVGIRPNGSKMDYGLILQPTKANPLSLPPDQREIFEYYGYGFYEDGYLL